MGSRDLMIDSAGQVYAVEEQLDIAADGRSLIRTRRGQGYQLT